MFDKEKSTVFPIKNLMDGQYSLPRDTNSKIKFYKVLTEVRIIPIARSINCVQKFCSYETERSQFALDGFLPYLFTLSWKDYVITKLK